MMRVTMAAVLTLALCGPATARDLELLEGAYEVPLGELALPTVAGGTAFFRPCADCATVGLRASTNTRYLLGSRELPLEEFTLAVDAIRQTAGGNAETLAAVYYDLQTMRVTRIAVFPR